MNRKLHRIREEEIWMAKHSKAHPEEEILERYAMGRLDEPELGEMEEHLLLCAHCQVRLDETSEYVSLMRKATEIVATARPVEAAWRSWLRLDWLPIPVPAMAGALVALVAILVWQPWSATAPNEWRTVELATLRGGAAANAGGVEGFALHMRLDVAGLDAAGASAQIVNVSGTVVTETPVAMAEGKAELRYAAGLPPGQYWVRLKKSGETVREYSLVVQAR
ncbi:MAG: hypothetical protein ACKV2U_33245 [Bryobacteraceae bacterium]